MGEAKKKRDNLTEVEKRGIDLTNKLIREGKLVAGGFAAYCMVKGISPDSPALAHLQDVYMHGAEHLWSSIMCMLDEGSEPTESDMRRMDLISKEIEEWKKRKEGELATAMPTKGSA